jgi:toxin ParE1/3/4
MTLKTISLKPRAQGDIRDAVAYYGREAGGAVAPRFAESVTGALDRLAARSASGSTRYAHELDLPGLRCIGVKRFPYLIFYMEGDDRVDVWRVLHAKRDLPSEIRELGGT